MRGFNMIEPVEVTDAVLTYSNVIEAAPAWNIGGTYAEGDVRQHQGRLWESLQDANTGHEPGADDPAVWWLDRQEAVAPRRMFDDFISTQTERADLIACELTIPAAQRVDAIWLDNLDATSVTVTQTDAIDGVVFTETRSLNDNSGVTDIWAYLTADIRRRAHALIEPRGGYAGSVIDIAIAKPGSVARCGDCVPGKAVRLGWTSYDGEDGVVSFSGKTRNEVSGGFEIVPRGYADTFSHNLRVARADYDVVRSLLIDARDQRRVFVAYAGVRGGIVNGYLTDWRTTFSTPRFYNIALSAESLA